MDVCHVSHFLAFLTTSLPDNFQFVFSDIFPGDSRKDWRSSGQLGRFESRLEGTVMRHLSHPLLVVLRRALILKHGCIGCFAPPKKGGWKKLRLFFVEES